MSHRGLARRALAEFVGVALLLIAVVGSGIAAQRFSPHDSGLQLLENSIATGVALAAIILAVGPVSGAHLNPAVSLVDRLLGGMTWTEMGVYWVAQLGGGVVGTVLANLMFALPALEISTKQRTSPGLWLGEVIATFGLLLVIFGVVRSGRASAAAFAVGAYIAGAYWFTSSTSFANPAVSVARVFSDTFAGIAPGSVPAFVVAQLIGAVLAMAVVRVLYPPISVVAGDVVVLREATSVPAGESIQVLAFAEVARELGITKGKVEAMVEAGELATVKVGDWDARFVPRAEVERVKANRGA